MPDPVTTEGFHVTLEGWPELQKTLQKMMVAMPDATLKGLGRTADRIVRDAKKNCPVKTGNLRSSIGKTISKPNLEVVVSAGAELGGKKEVAYAAAVEYGTGPCDIVPVNKKALSWVDKASGKRVFARLVHSPGRPPHPFFAPAVDANIMKAQSDVFDVMKQAAMGPSTTIRGTGVDDD